MRIVALLRAASLSAALCLPVAAVAPAAFAQGETYDFETDLWPAIQAQMQEQSRVELAQSDTLHLPGIGFSETGMTVRQSRQPAYYDEFDRYLDPHTGTPVPGTGGLFGE